MREGDTVAVSNPRQSVQWGLASFKPLPADEEFTVRFHAGSDRMAVGRGERPQRPGVDRMAGPG